MSAEFAVIGLGKFGRAVAIHISKQGHPVKAVDRNPERVESIEGHVDSAVRVDPTNEESLHDIEIGSVTCAVVAFGSDSRETSIMTTALLRQFGVPRIISSANDQLHARILRDVGAHEVMEPEKQMGFRLARRLSKPNVVDQAALGDARVAEIPIPESFVGGTLEELDLRNQYDVSVIAINRKDNIRANPDPDQILREEDVLYVVGSDRAVNQLAELP